MSRKRVTRDVWVVQTYTRSHGWEDSTVEDSRMDALIRLREYRENMPTYPHRLIKRRERIEPKA